MMTKYAYYNEIDPFCVEWLKELIKTNQIPDGIVDSRSIVDVKPEDVKDFAQCHFFAGIGGWAIALKLAQIPPSVKIWTGSPPCQPFSVAGKKKGKNDERHLAPEWFRLIAAVKPPILFGEQVEAAIAHGWWDDLADELENQNYETGAAVLPACSVLAPHQRKRLWFMGYAKRDGQHGCEKPRGVGTGENERGLQQSQRPDTPSIVANAQKQCGDGGSCPDDSAAQQPQWKTRGGSSNANFWGGGEYVKCPDGKERLIKPDICLLADGILNRTHKLRGYGNAIVPQVAAEFVLAGMEILHEL